VDKTEECFLFCGGAVGLIAIPPLGKCYIVIGSYLDANGCMKTYSYNQDSFILETKYFKGTDEHE
jgi:hypothetical protein